MSIIFFSSSAKSYLDRENKMVFVRKEVNQGTSKIGERDSEVQISIYKTNAMYNMEQSQEYCYNLHGDKL